MAYLVWKEIKSWSYSAYAVTVVSKDFVIELNPYEYAKILKNILHIEILKYVALNCNLISNLFCALGTILFGYARRIGYSSDWGFICLCP